MPAGTLSRAFLIFRASSGATCRVSPARQARHTASAATPPLPIREEYHHKNGLFLREIKKEKTKWMAFCSSTLRALAKRQAGQDRDCATHGPGPGGRAPASAPPRQWCSRCGRQRSAMDDHHSQSGAQPDPARHRPALPCSCTGAVRELGPKTAWVGVAGAIPAGAARSGQLCLC